MNALQLKGSLRCAKISWIATGQTLQVPRRKYVANMWLCIRPKNVQKTILVRDQRVLAPVLSSMDNYNVDTREA